MSNRILKFIFSFFRHLLQDHVHPGPLRRQGGRLRPPRQPRLHRRDQRHLPHQHRLPLRPGEKITNFPHKNKLFNYQFWISVRPTWRGASATSARISSPPLSRGGSPASPGPSRPDSSKFEKNLVFIWNKYTPKQSEHFLSLSLPGLFFGGDSSVVSCSVEFYFQGFVHLPYIFRKRVTLQIILAPPAGGPSLARTQQSADPTLSPKYILLPCDAHIRKLREKRREGSIVSFYGIVLLYLK